MINNRINKIRHVHEEKEFLSVESEDGISSSELKNMIEELLHSGVSVDLIKEEVLSHLGFKFSTLPDSIKVLLK